MGSHLPVYWLPLVIAVWMPLSFGITLKFIPGVVALNMLWSESCMIRVFDSALRDLFSRILLRMETMPLLNPGWLITKVSQSFYSWKGNLNTIIYNHWMPGLAFLVSLFIQYILAVSAGHVYPWLPSISATGTVPPESCWFGLFVNLSTFLLLFAGYIRHAQVREYTQCRPSSGPGQWTNLLATFIGLVSVIGLFIVANWQMTSAIRVHYFGSQCCFYGANIYFIFQTVFSFWMAPELNSLQVFVLRALLSLLMIALNIGTNVCNYMAWKLFNNSHPSSSYKEHLLWGPSDPGYGWHLAYTIMEWSLMLVFSLAVLSFFPDFRKIRLEEPTLKMKRLWRDEQSDTSRV